MTPTVILFSFAMQAASCLPVSGDVIRAGDLAEAVPAFASLPAEQKIGYAPAPGARRIFKASDLERAARRVGIDLDETPEVCFEWRLKVPSKAEFREAMLAALDLSDAQIEILETSRQPAPPGKIEFERSSLSPPPPGDPDRPVLWKGYVQYGERRRFAVWARVRITTASTRVLAASSIRAGEPIRPEHVVLETYQGFPFAGSGADSVEEVVGQVLRRSLRAGEPVPTHLLERPLDVKNGDFVEVRVKNSAIVIRGKARAESRGRRGETILVRNPSSGKTFHAKVTGPKQVSVRLGGE